ncbi:hypothetical protein B1A54_11830 [Corynebacterium diphtheriae]|nr:hypothetical protein CDHC02_1987 [Corynebacterium diphtheriae HC02]AEX84173.1 hypothetical protein CDVA01_1909 [Corynebacterium diphtheriae VA01]OLN12160.1 hypothetical protein BUE62_11900 [Corynebacterium diphtheriae]OSQ15131.1 hypothetical protein B1A54_11830 [Corynebacterium diphtheriae]OWM45759.1 hypothetical protein BU160_08460 [Corynebacterium diphtheriae]
MSLTEYRNTPAKSRTPQFPESNAAELAIPQLAANIKVMKAQRGIIAEQIASMLDDFLLS